MKTKTMKHLGLAALLASVAGLGKAWAVDYTDGTITVTPVASVSLNLSPSSYAFGNLDVNTSSNSATALNLSNTGNVSVTAAKVIQSNPADWTAVISTGAVDQYTLYCATAAARVPLAGFGAGTKFGAAANSSALTASDGVTSPVIPVAGSVDLWFRLDMPVSVSLQAPETITVRFTATAQ
jgi:hypothetical protein